MTDFLWRLLRATAWITPILYLLMILPLQAVTKGWGEESEEKLMRVVLPVFIVVDVCVCLWVAAYWLE